MASANSSIDTGVTADDQHLINRFARLHVKSEEIKSELRKKRSELQNINEACDELLLLDDEDAIPMRIGESFVMYESTSIGARLDQLREQCERAIIDMNANDAVIQTEMRALKARLYAKFGSNINLETDEE